MIADIVIAKHYQLAEVEIWAFAKSVLLLAASSCILGVDQVIVREPGALKIILRFLVVRGTILAIIIALGLKFFSNEVSGITWFVLVASLSFLSFMFAIYRGALKMFSAQLALNGWKFVFLLLVSSLIGSGLGVDIVLTISIVTSVLLIIFIMFSSKSWLETYKAENTELNKNQIISQSYKFVVLSLSLNLSINFEQIAINTIGGGENSALVFAHFTVFLPLIVFLNGFVGFYLGPLLRKSREKFNLKYYYRLAIVFVFSSIGLGFISYFMGMLAFEELYSGKYIFINEFAILTILIGALRLLYSLPSSYISILGSEETLLIYSKSNLLFVLMLFVGVMLLMKLGVSVPLSVLISSLINWFIRVAYGSYLSISELRKCQI
ncbi:hypothetical protein [Vibrio campbellii]|uniref:hypothetical protein n=1 Tax=Vibrio campbellii TaxID=680 RepID=UPI0038CD2441